MNAKLAESNYAYWKRISFQEKSACSYLQQVTNDKRKTVVKSGDTTQVHIHTALSKLRLQKH